VHSVWTDVRSLNSQEDERTESSTQKPEEMISRIVETYSLPGDLALDYLTGSGTTAAVAQKLGRRWIGADANKGVVQTTVKGLIDDFIAPTILERLRQQNKDNPLFQPQVSDWRSMVESVMIDADYDGEVFNIARADVPERKNDLVGGKYTVETKKGATVAVKVTDMLGEEVLVINKGT
jgi:DNA methylase